MKNEILCKILKKLKITTYKKQKHEQKAKITTKRTKYMLRQAFFPQNNNNTQLKFTLNYQFIVQYIQFTVHSVKTT